MVEGVNIVILGGTGDLARKKLFPSLHNLYKKGELEDFHIFGTSRHAHSGEEYRRLIRENEEDGSGWREFCENIHFIQLDFYESEDFKKLDKRLDDYPGYRLFYLAAPPAHFEIITENLARNEMVGEESKVVYEKPFGTDLESARKLNKHITESFSEDQVYRIDHYLDKELVENVSVLRFTNTVIEPIWRNDFIDHVQIYASEDFGIDGRGEFYDEHGVIEDFFQSHLLQLLALTAMQEPEKFNAQSIRDEKVNALRDVEVKGVIRGQFIGYTEEEGVEENSETETLAAVELEVANEKWEGIPFYLMSGKELEEEKAEIYIRFKNTPCKLFEGVCQLNPNELVISIKPDETIYFTVNTKVPGEMATEANKMEFCYSCKHGPETSEAYENLLLGVMEGDQRAFVREDEIEEQWKITESVPRPKVFRYEPGQFPEELREFLRRDGRDWHNI